MMLLISMWQCDGLSPLPKSVPTSAVHIPIAANYKPRKSALHTSCQYTYFSVPAHVRSDDNPTCEVVDFSCSSSHRHHPAIPALSNMSTTRRNIFQYLPPPAECLALVIGTLELLPFGIIGLRNPAFFADGYGLPISNTTSSSDASTATKPNSSGLSPEAEQQTKKALVAAIAARNVQNGVLLLTFGLVLRDRRSLGVAVLAGLVATLADTVIVRAYGVKDKVAGHYVGIFNSLAIGGSLLYWGRNDPLW
jgi:hypothetical protein